MTAGAFAILGALSIALNGVIVRRAVLEVMNAAAGVIISVPIGLPLFLIILIATGQIGQLAEFSWQSYLWLSAAGIVNFVVGRSLNYNSVKLVGATISNIMTRVHPLVAVTLGIILLNESLTWQLALGVMLIVLGLMSVGLDFRMLRKGNILFSGIPRKAIPLGIGAGVAWGVTPILIKLGLGDSGSPLAGVFISYLAASVALGISLWKQNRRVALVDMKSRPASLFCLAGLFSATAHLMRYIALSMAPASVVAPIFAVSPVFLLTLSFFFNRRLEVLSPAVIGGTVAVVIGAIIVL